MILRTSRVFPINPSHRSSSSMKRSLLHHLRPARPLLGRFIQQRKGLSSLSFVSNLDSFEDSSNTLLMLNLQSPLKVLKSPKPCVLHARNGFSLSSSQTYFWDSVRPALTCTARIPQTQLWAKENKSSTTWPPRRTLCRGIQLHSMQESHGISRETIETHSLRFLTWYAIT